jgi:starch phosphorylase
VYGPIDSEDKLVNVRSASLKLAGPADGTHRFEGQIPLDRTGSLGYTVRVLPKNAGLATPAELGVVTTA